MAFLACERPLARLSTQLHFCAFLKNILSFRALCEHTIEYRQMSVDTFELMETCPVAFSQKYSIQNTHTRVEC